VPQLQLQVKTEEARRFGVAPGWLTEELEEALAGVSVAEVYDGIKSLDLVVRYGERWRTDLEVLGMIPLVLPDGRAVPLKNLVELQTGTGPNQILHENASRRLVLSANTAGRDLGSIVKDIQTVLTNFPLPASTYFSLGGQFESQQQATRNLAVLSLFSILGMYLVLFTHFQSHLLTLQVLLNIPLALIGSVAALWISGQPVSVATLVGFITLCGIASRNTILMISHYLQLQQEGESGVALVIRGSLERLVPVSMTALCAGIGLLPLAFAGGQPGKEILTPVAQVILGGLVSSTLLDMVVTPTVFLYTHQKFLR
jgi:Cu/Ag efflux pump CusA